MRRLKAGKLSLKSLLPHSSRPTKDAFLQKCSQFNVVIYDKSTKVFENADACSMVAVSKLIGKVSAFTAIRGGNSPSPQNASSLPLTRAAFQCATSYQARMCAMNEALARMKSACCSKVG